MELLQQRHWLYLEHSLGIISINGMAECFSLEDAMLEIPGRPVEEWKIYGNTAIGVGRFPLLWTKSNRFKKFTLEYGNVPGFTGIRMHAGTTADDTIGCTLAGGMCDLDGAVYKSRIALEKLEAKVVPVILKGLEKVWITVANPLVRGV